MNMESLMMKIFIRKISLNVKKKVQLVWAMELLFHTHMTLQLGSQLYNLVVPHGVDFEALDGQPSRLFFMIAAPEGGDNTHLQALAALSQVLMNPDVVTALKAADTPDKVQDIFAEAVAKKEAENKAEEEAEKVQLRGKEDQQLLRTFCRRLRGA